MPATDPEPENYSIDDMMDRLRSRGGTRDGEPKLVTREDGTQAYKMRKRKRRSHQPKKEKEKRHRQFRVAQVVAAVGLVAGSGLTLLGSVLYLNSPGYHRKIEERVRLWTGAEPKITQFRVSPVSAGAATLELQWPETSMLQSLKVAGVRADLRADRLLGGKWKGAEMVAAQGGTLVLRQPQASGPRPSATREGDCPFEFRFRSPQLDVLMGGDTQAPVRLKGTEATLDVLDPAATKANLRFEGGIMEMAGWGEFGIKFASIQFEPSGARIGNLRLQPGTEPHGEIEILNPDQTVLNLDGGASTHAVRVHRVLMSSLLGPGFGSWLTGEIETPEDGEDGSLTFKSSKPVTLSCRIPFGATAASAPECSGLPMLGLIAREIGESWYQNPRFDEKATGTLVRGGDSGGLEDLRFQARNRLIVTGQVMADAKGVLDGAIEVGLPDASVNEARSAFRSVFKRREGGYSWASVRLSGTGRQPQDDLQKQVDAAATAISPTTGDKDALEDAFRELTNPSDKR